LGQLASGALRPFHFDRTWAGHDWVVNTGVEQFLRRALRVDVNHDHDHDRGSGAA